MSITILSDCELYHKLHCETLIHEVRTVLQNTEAKLRALATAKIPQPDFNEEVNEIYENALTNIVDILGEHTGQYESLVTEIHRIASMQ